MSEIDTQADTDTSFTLKVPDVGEGVAEVEIVTWAVEVGQAVARLQTVAEVMTDKATVEVPSPVDGVVAELGGSVGDVLLVGSPLLRLDTGASPSSADETQADQQPGPRSTEPPSGVARRPHSTGAPIVETEAATATDTVTGTLAGSAGRPVESGGGPSPRRRTGVDPSAQSVLATPAVRRRARDAGLDLRRVRASGHATGPAGRITHDDIDAYLAAGPGHGADGTNAGPGSRSVGRVARTGSTSQPMVGLRRRIARQMVTSATTIPHITYVEEVDVTALEDLRTNLNQRAATVTNQPRVTLLPFLVRALTNAVAEYPIFNAHLVDAAAADGDRQGDTDILTVFDGVHVGIATQTDNGLVVPVVRHAEANTLWSTASAIAELSEATRTGAATAEDLSGSTITITSLGALGGVVTTPIINKPEVAIVGVNKIVVRPVWVDGEFVPRKIMNLSSSFDHRVIDGWDAANFVQAIRTQLEQPALLFIDDLDPDQSGLGTGSPGSGR